MNTIVLYISEWVKFTRCIRGYKMEEEILNILEQARGGDNEAYRYLIEYYSPKLKSIGRHYLNSYFDIDDVVQEVWIKIYENFYALRDPTKFPNWIGKIMRYHCLKKLKKESRNIDRTIMPSIELTHELTEILIDNESDITDYVERKELRQVINKILKAMPEIYSLPLRLYYIEDLKLKEIEEILDLPNSTIKWRLYQGRAIFKKNIGNKLKGYYYNFGR